MSWIAPFVPLAAAILIGFWFWRFNKPRGWFTTGELLFWNAVLLIVLQLVWLRWF